jgi:Domain of unknown function (DUF4384)
MICSTCRRGRGRPINEHGEAAMTRDPCTVPKLGGKLGLAVARVIAINANWAAADDVSVPTDPAEKAAFDVLTKHCARCHQAGRLEGRQKPAKDFGNILKFSELAVNSRYVLPGNPHGSLVIKQIENGNMPYDAAPNGAAEAPTPDEVKVMVSWVEGLSTRIAACDHKFIGDTDVLGFIAADLADNNKVPHSRQKGTRYLTLTNWSNVCVDRTSKDAMEVYRHAAIKLVNSLSRSSDVVRLEAIDPDRTILRLNLDDIGWNSSDWDTVLAEYPYPALPDSQLTSMLESATGSKLPYVRADWFVFTASKPKLYNTLLTLPASFQQLAKDQNVDVTNDIKSNRVLRAGFAHSGVSAHNRLIERHASKAGYFWTSYDFRGDSGKKNLFEFPLGPGAAVAVGGEGFEHDGGETLFSLPNGFQAYYLNNAKGEPLDKGPTDIVGDPDRVDKQVTNGISCMGCHENDAGLHGIRKASDEIRDIALNERAFSKDVREAIKQLYPEHPKLTEVLQQDSKRFTDAMIRAGLNADLKLNGIEMVNALSKRYEDPLDGALAAAELGMTKEQFEKAIQGSSPKVRTIRRRLVQGTVPREDFENRFKEVAGDIADHLKAVVFKAPDGKAVEIAKAVTAATDTLSLSSDKTVYSQGEAPVFTIKSDKDCFLTVADVDENNKGGVIFPNRFEQDNAIKAGVELSIPAANALFRFHLDDKGTETVVAVCTVQNFDVDGIKHDFAKADVTTVNDYNGTVARSISKTRQIRVQAAQQDKAKPTPSADKVKATKSDASASAAAQSATAAVTRAAIKIQVH